MQIKDLVLIKARSPVGATVDIIKKRVYADWGEVFPISTKIRSLTSVTKRNYRFGYQQFKFAHEDSFIRNIITLLKYVT